MKAAMSLWRKPRRRSESQIGFSSPRVHDTAKAALRQGEEFAGLFEREDAVDGRCCDGVDRFGKEVVHGGIDALFGEAEGRENVADELRIDCLLHVIEA